MQIGAEQPGAIGLFNEARLRLFMASLRECLGKHQKTAHREPHYLVICPAVALLDEVGDYPEGFIIRPAKADARDKKAGRSSCSTRRSRITRIVSIGVLSNSGTFMPTSPAKSSL